MQPLFAAIRQTPCQGEFTLELQRTPRRAARDASVLSELAEPSSIRFTHLWLQPPEYLKSLPPIAVDVLLKKSTLRQESPHQLAAPDDPSHH